MTNTSTRAKLSKWKTVMGAFATGVAVTMGRVCGRKTCCSTRSLFWWLRNLCSCPAESKAADRSTQPFAASKFVAHAATGSRRPSERSSGNPVARDAIIYRLLPPAACMQQRAATPFGAATGCEHGRSHTRSGRTPGACAHARAMRGSCGFPSCPHRPNSGRL
ncbi:hypothetical protein MRX96_058490 [Rhipicephalus microplus]